jgi:hypothetical protein
MVDEFVSPLEDNKIIFTCGQMVFDITGNHSNVDTYSMSQSISSTDFMDFTMNNLLIQDLSFYCL